VLARMKAVLPLINKRWAQVLRGSSCAWRVISIGRTYHRGQDEQTGRAADMAMNPVTMVPWFTSRPG